MRRYRRLRMPALFRQLFDRVSCTYTYLLADESTRKALIIVASELQSAKQKS